MSLTRIPSSLVANTFTSNTVLFANALGYLSNSSSLQYFSGNNTISVGAVVAGGIDVINYTQAAFNAANAAGSSAYVQSAFDKANSANSLAQSAYNYANTITGINYLSNNSIETANSSNNQVIDTFSTAKWRTAKYLIQVVSGENVHSTELFLTHNDTNVLMTQYGEIYTTNLMSLDAEIVSGNLMLMLTPVNSVNYVDVVRTSLIARTLSVLPLEGDLNTQSGMEDLNIGSGLEDLNL
jgi:hypothetical protein